MSFVFLVLIVNILAVQYEKGYLRQAANEGARAGALVIADPQSACLTREADVLSNLGGMAQNVQNTCVTDGAQVKATASASFAGWLPIVPTFNESATAVSASEKAAAPK